MRYRIMVGLDIFCIASMNVTDKYFSGNQYFYNTHPILNLRLSGTKLYYKKRKQK